MTYNEKKRYFERYSYNVRRIKRLQQEYEKWETIGTNITQKFSDSPIHVSGANSKIEQCAMHLANIQDSILHEVQEAEAARAEIESVIDSIKDIRRREIIQMRYIQDIPIWKIAVKLDKDKQNVYKMIQTTIRRINL